MGSTKGRGFGSLVETGPGAVPNDAPSVGDDEGSRRAGLSVGCDDGLDAGGDDGASTGSDDGSRVGFTDRN